MDDDTDPLKELLATLRDQVDEKAIHSMDAVFLRAAREVVALWRRWWGLGEPIAVPLPVELKFRMICPLAFHALNNVVVGLDLSQRLPWIAAEHARIAFEHALTAQWVLLTHEGEQKLHVEFQNEAHKRAKEFHQGLGSPSEYAAMVGAEPPKSDWSVWNACARFADSPQLFYDIYRNLSGATHPSNGTVMAYLNITPDAEVTGLNPTGSASPCDETPRALGISALWALDALEELRETQPHVLELTTIGESAGLPTCLRDSDQHPERQRAPKFDEE
ncbi:MAG: hypothetical protein ACR2P2_08720 [Nakamurella sp.]